MALADIRQEQIRKLQVLRELGVDPYPYSFSRTHRISELLSQFDALVASRPTISLAGRILAMRRHGKTTFLDIADQNGSIQVYCRADTLSADNWALLDNVSVGDFLGVSGTAFSTKTAEPTIAASSVTLLAKALRPLPDKHFGLRQKEMAQRQRYVELAIDPMVRQRFIKRTSIYNAMRAHLAQLGYLEVETPILQPLYGGALARPFETHFNALDANMYLRIADELYLKRLIVGGYDGVFEFGKDFRNEGMDKLHNPEFTQLEVYVAYDDYRGMMTLCGDLIEAARIAVGASRQLQWQGQSVDLSQPWRELSMVDSIREFAHVDIADASDSELASALSRVRRVSSEGGLSSRSQLIDDLFGACVEPNLIDPTFITDFPKVISPLAKVHRVHPQLTERFELFVAGREMANSFSELNDPLDQRARFESQAEYRARGDMAAHAMDEDYLRALEYGMPPTGGLGIGMDRLTMLLLELPSIRDVLFFPHLRPEEGLGDPADDGSEGKG